MPRQLQASFCLCPEEKRVLVSIDERLGVRETIFCFLIIASLIVSRSSSDHRKGSAWAQTPDYFADDFED